MKRLKPLNDVIFKKIFGENNNKELLIGFLNSVLPNEIVDLSIVEEKLSIDKIDDKQGILDIKAICSSGERINIEVQLQNQYNMEKRTLFYWSKLYTENFKAKGEYNQLQKTITINIVDFSILNTVNYHSSFHIYEDAEKTMLTDDLEIHFIEYPKFKSMPHDLNDPLQRWLVFLQEDAPEELLKEVVEMDNIISQADQKLRRLSDDEETIRMYQLREKALSDMKTQISGAKEEATIDNIRKILKNKPSMSVQDIADMLEVDIELVKRVAKEIR